MNTIKNTLSFLLAGIGGALGFFLGSCDGLLYALLVFISIDYITGIMCAIATKTLSSEIGFKGICRKVLIFMLVGIGHILDVYIINAGSILRPAVISFYLSNEGISILENSSKLGLPIPKKISCALKQLHREADEDKEGD